jgi:hypothetical protein
MSAEKAPNVWVPVCCARVMRFNIFGRMEEGAFGALTCRICGRNITLEQENAENLHAYGERASVVSVIGTPRPPTDDRRKPAAEVGSDDPTL